MVNKADCHGRTALTHAVLRRDEALCLLLLEPPHPAAVTEEARNAPPFSRAVSARLKKAPVLKDVIRQEHRRSRSTEWRTWRRTSKSRGHARGSSAYGDAALPSPEERSNPAPPEAVAPRANSEDYASDNTDGG